MGREWFEKRREMGNTHTHHLGRSDFAELFDIHAEAEHFLCVAGMARYWVASCCLGEWG